MVMQGGNVLLWGWDSDNNVPVKVLVNAAGKLIIDPSEILEDTPTDGEVAKAPTSNWAHDHEANASAHHVKYTDAEAIAAAKTDPTLLNYTQGARVYHDAPQSIPNVTWTTLALNSERWDTDTIHDLVTNNSRLTCKTAGKYFILGQAGFATNATGRRIGRILLNGVTVIGQFEFTTSAVATFGAMFPSTIYALAVNDYVELQVYQGSGAALDTYVETGLMPEFMMQRIG